MQYLCIYRSARPETDAPPSPQDFEKMGKLIDEMTKAGVLLTTGGCAPSAKGVRVRIDGGKYTVTDGPFAETKELICGFAMIQVRSKAEAVEWTKRFLSVVGEGESEVRLMNEFPAE